jgi:hypothetical protein
LFVLSALLLAAAFAGPEIRTDTQGLMGRGDTVDFTVLDVNDRFAALRQVYTIHDEAVRPIECDYPGLNGHSTAGVQLALLELKTGAVTTFDVYESAHDGGGHHPQPCTPSRESEGRLAAAYDAFAKAGLNPDRRPEPDIDYAIERDSTGAPVLSSVIPVGVDIDDDGYETHVWTVPLHWREHPLEIRTTDRREFMGTTTIELADDEHVFYRATRQYDRKQAGRGDVNLTQGYWTSEGMVFLEVFHSFTAMRDSGHTYLYGMTPPIPAWTPWTEIAFELVPEQVTPPANQHVTLLVGEPGRAPTRIDLGMLEGRCGPLSSTTPMSLLLWCGQGSSSTTLVVRKDDDQLVVERYTSGTPTDSPERLQEISIPAESHIRILMGH